MKALLVYLVSLLAGTTLLTSATDPTETAKRKKHFNLEKNVALEGYDPVAYFTQHKAMKGNPAHQFTYEGVIYQFSSPAHLEAFKQNPGKYEPQYGGWCAYAMGDSGEKVEVDPETFKVKDGKLYLFYNKYFNNTLTKWNKDETSLQKKADLNWPKLYI